MVPVNGGNGPVMVDACVGGGLAGCLAGACAGGDCAGGAPGCGPWLPCGAANGAFGVNAFGLS